MKNLFYIQKNLFFLSLISSIFICLSSSSFISMWISMELNLFSFIPMISMEQKIFSEKSTMMYFLIQSISSSMVIISISFNMKSMKNMIYTIIFISIFMKLGMFPFHFWMISTLEGMSWKLNYILMTFQKIIPMCVMFTIIKQKTIILFCLLNSFISAISGITMFSMRKILGFSSINHLSIMLIAMIISKKTFKIYFIIYSFMTMSATKFLMINNMNFIFQTMTSLKYNKMSNLISLTIFMSMAGIPPFIGFMPKLFTIMMMMKMNMFFSSFLILIMNTLSTLFYTRICMNNILMNMNKKKI